MPYLKAAVALSALALASSANAMEYSYRLYHNQVVIDASGQIQFNESQIYANWLSTHPELSARRIVSIVFNSAGGDPVGAATLGELIQHFRLNTGVAGGGVCASACVFAWGAGALKSAAPDSGIGVHQPALTIANGAVTPTDAKGFLDFASAESAALARLGAPANVIEAEETTPPSSIYWLTPADLAAWNVHITR